MYLNGHLLSVYDDGVDDDDVLMECLLATETVTLSAINSIWTAIILNSVLQHEKPVTNPNSAKPCVCS
jgi:hypothetical protein